MKVSKIPLMLCALGASLIVITLFCMQKVQAHPCIELPAPTGPFAVGTIEYHLIDKTRKEVRYR